MGKHRGDKLLQIEPSAYGCSLAHSINGRTNRHDNLGELSYEIATYKTRFGRNRASLRDCVIRRAGEDRLRPRHGFFSIQNLLLAEGSDTRPAMGQPDQGRREWRFDCQRPNSSRLGRRSRACGDRDDEEPKHPEYLVQRLWWRLAL